MEKYFDYLNENLELNFKINDDNSQVLHTESETIFIEKDSNKIVFHLLNYNEESQEFIPRYKNIKRIRIPSNFDFTKILGNKYRINFYTIISRLLNFEENDIEEINVVNYKNRLKIENQKIEIGTDKLESLYETSKEINDKGNSSRNSLINFLINTQTSNFNGAPKKNTTYYNSGDFAFQTRRLNIDIKNSKKDFERYLNVTDIKSLQKLTEKLIKLEVFESDFIKVLDNYFIKQKLQEIISLGREILELKSDDIKTIKAQAISSKLRVGEEIKQLESFWQVYFEKYLLHLIFSYRELFPKVKFTIDAEKKYPDFVGINHYWGVDIIEIKHHLLPVLRYDESHKNYAFSSDLSKAIIQSMNYMDALIQEKITRKYKTEIFDELDNSILNKNIHRPTAIIIISSKDRLVKSKKQISEEELEKINRDFTKLRNSLSNIKILTFDEILDMADNYQSNIFKE
ncbi:Shedu anti-phage system protein SduA domain-containing protein [Weeksellaceae bacterium A-14]